MLSPVRSMTREDIPSAMELSVAAKWNQTQEDWLRLIHLAPETCRCIEDSGRIVATTTLLPFGTRLAWIGMVLTRPEYRRQGLARRLLEDAISSAARLGIRTLKLDATNEGRPLYEALGFVAEQAIERWERNADAGLVKGQGGCDSSARGVHISKQLLTEDEAAFGASRDKLLKALTQSGTLTNTANGYALSRRGRTARYFGPCVARSVTEARQLVAAHVEELEVRWYWDLLPANTEAVRCAEEYGFTRQRLLWRMRRGEALQNNDAMVYAIAGFELG